MSRSISSPARAGGCGCSSGRFWPRYRAASDPPSRERWTERGHDRLVPIPTRPGSGWFVATLILILLIALPLMLAVAMIIYADRKIWAAMALRRGPNVVGPFGLLQSFADGLKVFLKETIIPSSANRGLFLIAPIITFTVALIAWAVIPFSRLADGTAMVLADINVGLLYLLAISSLGVYGIIIFGLGFQLEISVLQRVARRRSDGFL